MTPILSKFCFWAAPATKLSVLCFVGILLFVLGGPLQAQGFAGFGYERPITFDHTKVALSDQVNLPVVISGTYSYLATVANGGKVQNANGYDIIFASDAAGSQLLNWEIESYSANNGTISFWVKVPSLSHTVDTVIYMLYGKSGVSSFQGGPTANVWDSNYVAVWHLSNGSLVIQQLMEST